MSNDENVKIPLGEIQADPEFNCRGKISPLDVIDLWKSIEKQGLLQPIVVKYLDKPIGKLKYRIVCGFRRFMAHVVGEQKDVLCRIIACTDEEAEIMNFTENLQRLNLNPYQEAINVARFHNRGWQQDKIATQFKVSRTWVISRLKIMSLPEDIKKEVASGLISVGQAVVLFDIKEPEKQMAAARKVKEAAERGEKIKQKALNDEFNAAPTNVAPKKAHTRVEIFKMMEFVMEKKGAGIHTQCMAWCAGEISDDELRSAC